MYAIYVFIYEHIIQYTTASISIVTVAVCKEVLVTISILLVA